MIRAFIFARKPLAKKLDTRVICAKTRFALLPAYDAALNPAMTAEL